jgi:hypothetical protein
MPAALPVTAPPAVFEAPLRWWEDVVARSGALPTRADLRPEALSPTCIPHLLLVEVVDGGADLRIRLVGQHIRDRSRWNHAGQLLSEMIPSRAVLSYVLGLYGDVVRLRRPVWTLNRAYARPGVPPVVVRRLLLPIAGPGDGTVGHLFGAQIIDYPPGTPAHARDLWFDAPMLTEGERIVL